MNDTRSISDRLTDFLAAQHREGEPRAEVGALARAGAGRSRDNWLFDLLGDVDEHLILRCDPPGGLVETDRRTEFEILRALERSGLPTPVARWLDADGSWFGRPALIMRRLPGDCDYRVLSDDQRSLADRRELAESFCELLADVHAVDWAATEVGAVLADPGKHAAETELDRWHKILTNDQLEPSPVLELAFTVLREHAPLSDRTVLVHADFKPGNILLDGQRVTALLDWELAHLGDPLEDLGWVTQPLRTGEHLIPGAWSADDLVSHYESVTGATVDRRALAWWVGFAALKTAVMQVSGLRSFLEGRSDVPFRPTRRVLNAVLDAVEAFEKEQA
ncbi:phosphotransferase family protein [Gordonia terrae]